MCIRDRYELARAFELRMQETGVRVHLNHQVTEIVKRADRVSGVIAQVPDGSTVNLSADYVISNMEVVPACAQLLREPPRVMKRLEMCIRDSHGAQQYGCGRFR